MAVGEPHIAQLRHEKIDLPPAPRQPVPSVRPQGRGACLKQQVLLHPDSPGCDSVGSTPSTQVLRDSCTARIVHTSVSTRSSHACSHVHQLCWQHCAAPLPCRHPAPSARHRVCTHTRSLQAAQLSFVSGCCVQWGQSHSHPHPSASPCPPLAHTAPRVGTHTRYGSAARQLLGKGKKNPHRFSRERERGKERENDRLQSPLSAYPHEY